MIVGLIFCLTIMGIKIHFDLPYRDIYSIYCAILSGQYYIVGLGKKKIFTVLWYDMGMYCDSSFYSVFDKNYLVENDDYE